VLAFYHAVYGASEGYASRSGWNGDVVGLVPGTTSAALKEDVVRRVNFYRALAGLAADVTLNSEKSAKAQEAALLMARNGGLSHAPALEAPAWVGTERFPSGVEASASSNLSLGAFGPAAVDGQIRDDGESNWQVGHRRWLLSPALAEVGTGDIPPQAGFQAANAVWVYGNFRSASPPQFVAWPSGGYVPAKLLPKRWSVSYAGADFSKANVRVSRGGVAVGVRILSRSEGPADGFQGEKTLVWEPALAALSGREDVRYRVEVSGIRIGSELRSLDYEVVAFDPEEMEETPSITGPDSVTVLGGTFALNAAAGADAHELTVARGSAAPWLEGAEGPDEAFLTQTSPGYAVVQTQVVASGGRAFHLTHPGGTAEGFSDQILQLKRRLVPGPDSVLQFSETGRFSETTTTLNAEVSVDDGRTWTAVWSRGGVGLHSSLFDAGWNPHAVKLGSLSGRALLVRFSLKSNGGAVAAGTTREHGFFLDNIVVTNGLELVDGKVTTLAAGSSGFELNRMTAGAFLMEGNRYFLSVAPRIGAHLFPSGGLKVVSVPVVSAMASAAAQEPPRILVQPLEARVAAGFPAVFNVVATGAGILGYQWRKNGVDIPGGTQATYRIEDAQTADTGARFDVVVTGGAGSVISTTAGLTVVEGGAFLSEQPTGTSLLPGASYTLRVTAADADAKYQWRKDGSPISGATGSSYTISGVGASAAGRYDVEVAIWAGTVISSPAYVGVATRVVPDLQRSTYSWGTIAGNRGFTGSADGTGSVAHFNSPSAIAMDGLGNLYVADTGNHVIRRVTQAGAVTTVAGRAGISGTLNGSATSVARFKSPAGIAVDAAGSVYIAEPESNTIRKLTKSTSSPGGPTLSSGGAVTTIAGVADRFDLPGGLNGPNRLAVDSNGTVYFQDWTSIRRVDGVNQFTLLYGALQPGEQPVPTALAVGAGGRLFAAVNEGNAFRILSKTLTGSFAPTNHGPYAFLITDLTIGSGDNLFAATESSVQLLGDVSQSAAAAALPTNLIPSVGSDLAPSALAVDSQGTVFAVDPYAHAVIRGVPTGLPVFVLQPERAVQAGGAVTLTATAVGAGTVSYQWYRDGFLISGATNPAYTMAAGGISAGTYTVVASNLAGAVTSETLSVEGVVVPLRVSSLLPPAVTVVSGSSTTLSFGWEGPSNTAFQWFRNGVPVSGGTSAELRFSPARGSDAGIYRVTLKAGATVLSGGTVNFTVNVPVSIFNQPEEEVAVLQGKPLTLRVSAAGTPPLSYQWRRNGSVIQGGTGSSYAIREVTGVSAGTYTVQVSNAFGVVESTPSRVSVVVPPTVTVQGGAVQYVNEGSGLSLSASATGAEPLSYQWRKDGVPLVGAASAVLSRQRLEAQDAGFYDVVVSNAAGSETSGPVQVVVNLPPRIVVRPPASIEATAGAAVRLRVVAAGTGPLSYQWLAGGVPIAGGTSSVYEPDTVAAGTAVYSVKVTSPSHPEGMTQQLTTLTVKAGRGIAVLREPAAQNNVIRGTAAVLKLSVDPTPPDAVQTTYRLLTYPAGAETGISGVVSASGEIDVAVRSLTTGGSYAVSLSREYLDGTVVGPVRVGPFVVELRTLEDAAGTYELLVNDLNGLIGDGALYRGMILATVTRTGAVSGRVLYNESARLAGTLGSERAYWAVTRSFSGVFVPSEADPSKLVCALRPGVGSQANRQRLDLELDFSAPTVELSALVRDIWSGGARGESRSQGSGAVRGLTRLTGVVVGGGSVDLSSLVGRYAIGSEFGLMWQSGPGADNNATLFAQVLPTGRVVWGSRLSGSTGTGSATLSATSQAQVFARIYQGRTTSAGALSTSSLLGQLRFERAGGWTTWSAGVLTSSGEDRLERQSCYVTRKDANGAPAFDSALFDLANAGSLSFNWSEVRSLDFQSGSTCRWPGSTARDLSAFFNADGVTSAASPAQLFLTAEDPDGGQTYVWTISLSATGVVRASNYFPGTVQPTLTFRLDRTRGEWSGSFISAGTRQRCSLFGTVVRAADGGPLRGAGWLEAGAIPSTRTGGWELKLVAP
jgi:hypothetical protein